MAFTVNTQPPHIEIISQRQIDLENSWWKERFMIYEIYWWKFDLFYHDSYLTTLSGYWWHHHRIQLGPIAIDFRIRGKRQNT